MKCKMLFVTLISVIAVFFAGCGSKVSKINDAIMGLDEGQEVTQEELDSLFEDYETLSDKDKEKIENYETLAKYKDVNIDAVRELQSALDGITDETTLRNLMEIKNQYDAMNENEKNLLDTSSVQDKLDSLENVKLDDVEELQTAVSEVMDQTDFSVIVELKEMYDKLNQNEKNLVDFSTVESKFELTDVEKAALEAARNVKSCMKSQSSFKVRNITVKNDLASSSFYWVLIQYSGDNSFGVSVDSTSCFGIDPSFQDPFFPLAQLTGIQKYLEGTESYLEYTKCVEPEEEIDVNKIHYYLEQ